MHHGAAARGFGPDPVRGPGSAWPGGRGARAAGHRLRPAGAGDFLAAHGGGEPAHRPGGAPSPGARTARAALSDVSGAEADVAAARRGSVGRTAAAAGDRARAGAGAETADPG